MANVNYNEIKLQASGVYVEEHTPGVKTVVIQDPLTEFLASHKDSSNSVLVEIDETELETKQEQ